MLPQPRLLQRQINRARAPSKRIERLREWLRGVRPHAERRGRREQRQELRERAARVQRGGRDDEGRESLGWGCQPIDSIGRSCFDALGPPTLGSLSGCPSLTGVLVLILIHVGAHSCVRLGTPLGTPLLLLLLYHRLILLLRDVVLGGNLARLPPPSRLHELRHRRRDDALPLRVAQVHQPHDVQAVTRTSRVSRADDAGAAHSISNGADDQPAAGLDDERLRVRPDVPERQEHPERVVPHVVRRGRLLVKVRLARRARGGPSSPALDEMFS